MAASLVYDYPISARVWSLETFPGPCYYCCQNGPWTTCGSSLLHCGPLAWRDEQMKPGEQRDRRMCAVLSARSDRLLAQRCSNAVSKCVRHALRGRGSHPANSQREQSQPGGFDVEHEQVRLRLPTFQGDRSCLKQ